MTREHRYGLFCDAVVSDDMLGIDKLLAADFELGWAPEDATGTPLHVAVEHGSLGGVVRLLAAGADPNGRTAGGWTPLVHAVDLTCDAAQKVRRAELASEHVEVIKTLLAHEANSRLVSPLGSGRTGQRASDLARHYGRVELAEMLDDALNGR